MAISLLLSMELRGWLDLMPPRSNLTSQCFVVLKGLLLVVRAHWHLIGLVATLVRKPNSFNASTKIDLTKDNTCLLQSCIHPIVCNMAWETPNQPDEWEAMEVLHSLGALAALTPPKAGETFNLSKPCILLKHMEALEWLVRACTDSKWLACPNLNHVDIWTQPLVAVLMEPSLELVWLSLVQIHQMLL